MQEIESPNTHTIERRADSFSFNRTPALRLLIGVAIATSLFALRPVPTRYAIPFIIVPIFFIKSDKYGSAAYWFCIMLIGLFCSNNLSEISINAPNKVLPEFKGVFLGEVVKVFKADAKSCRVLVRGKLDLKPIEALPNSKIILDIYKPKSLSYLRPGYNIYAKLKARIPRKNLFPYQFDEQFYAKANGAQFYARCFGDEVKFRGGEANFYSIINDWSADINRRIFSLFSPSTRGVAQALVSGEKSELNAELKNQYAVAGAAHVLAVSGLHVGIISIIIFTLLGFIENRPLKFAIFLICLAVYCGVSGFGDSVIRAALMSALALYALVIDRKSNALNIISLATLILIIYDPSYAYSPGFQMSVASVFGIIILYPILKKSFFNILPSKNIVLKFLIESLAITISASILVSPIVAYYFGVFSIVSPLVNIPVVPIMNLAMVFSFISVAFSFISFPIDSLYADSAGMLIELSNRIVEYAAKLPYSYIKSELMVGISILVSLSIFYLFTSKSLGNLLFRGLILCSAVMLIYIRVPFDKRKTAKIFPLNNCVIAELPIDRNKTFFYISDRKNTGKPKADYSLVNYILSDSSEAIIAVDGYCGISTVDMIRKRKAIKAFSMDFSGQELLRTTVLYAAFNRNIKLCQIIDYKE
jgi:ComEC/Rec2-related protein